MRPLLLLLTLVLTGCASALIPDPPLQADVLTVSGRHALPRADGSPLAGRLQVAQVTVDSGAAVQMKTETEAYRALVQGALEKSLRNYGYLAEAGTGEPIRLNVAVPALELKTEKEATGATARLRITPAASAPECLAREARADFRAFSPKKSGTGQRAFAVVAGLTLAILSGPTGAGHAGTFMGEQFLDASARNAAMNARRQDAYGEAVAPTFDKAMEARFAGSHAVQLAIADYIAHLGRACRS